MDGLVSRASMIRLSLHPLPASETSAFNKIRAFSTRRATSLTPIWRIASTIFWPCETRTPTCRNFATISSGLYRFLAIAVLLDVKDIPQVGPLQWGWIIGGGADGSAPASPSL